ncbi:MAG: HAMP domain-containing histidine kinase [Oscillospiraceae bacterium]|nr:HAMP domain-containing histidine kinase [Oscillospiraceae bacterium]
MANFIENFTKGLRRRWLRSTVFVALLGVVFVVAMFSIFIYSYYFASIRTGLETKARTATDFIAYHVERSYDSYFDSAFRYAETFPEAERIEMQFLNRYGSVMISSSGFTSGASPDALDIQQALEFGRISSWVGRRASTGERIMAVSAPLAIADGEIIGVLRYVTSLRHVDRQVFLNILMVVSIGLVVLAIVLALNMVFIRFVITPVSEITKMAKRIAEGSYGIQINDDYPDEIGDMVGSINEMSLKIAQTEKIQSEFISSISHELRTPLTAITGWGETLIYTEGLDNESKRGIDIMLKEARRLTKMVEEMLEFTRIEDGRFTLNIEQIDISAELEDAIFAFRELLHQDEISFDYHNDIYDIPNISGDPNRLKQVFFNIFDNALKYGREGKRIEVYIGLIDEQIVITIRDFGPGVPEDEIENLTMKFYKGSNSKERGSGIGLAVCEEIIKYHGGRLELSNANGGGFLVTIVLPAVGASADIGDI